MAKPYSVYNKLWRFFVRTFCAAAVRFILRRTMTQVMPTSRPSRARFRVLTMLMLLAALTYLDRLAISAAAPAIRREFGFSPVQMGYIFSAFTLAYAAFEIPSGWLGDRYGTRRALTRIVLWWSAFTVLTAATTGFASLLVVRFLFGMGEAGAIPNSAGTVARWFPVSQQGRALGAVCIGHAIGATITPPLVFKLIEWQGWRLPFIEFGLLGLVWCAVWYWWFRDQPAAHAAVNTAEVALIRAGQSGEQPHAHGASWGMFLQSRNLRFLCAMYFAYGYSLYFYITWLPTYLLEARHFSTQYAGYFSALPWLFGAVAFLCGGWATDWIARHSGNRRLARCGMGVFGLMMSALVMANVPRTENNTLAAVLIAFALFFQFLTTPSVWAACLDIARQNAGVVTGTLNTTGNLAGTLAPIVFGYIVGRWHSWSIPFYVAACFLAIGVVMWLFVDPRRTLVEESMQSRTVLANA
jgi:MFS transporter, ACS family, glucarate transporter